MPNLVKCRVRDASELQEDKELVKKVNQYLEVPDQKSLKDDLKNILKIKNSSNFYEPPVYGGIGVDCNIEDTDSYHVFKVTEVIKGSPAQASGLKAGLVIWASKDRFATLEDAVKSMRNGMIADNKDGIKITYEDRTEFKLLKYCLPNLIDFDQKQVVSGVMREEIKYLVELQKQIPSSSPIKPVLENQQKSLMSLSK